MPFGLKNAGMMFKCYMDHIFNKLVFIFIYVDIGQHPDCQQKLAGASSSSSGGASMAPTGWPHPQPGQVHLRLAFSGISWLSSQQQRIHPLAAKVEALRRHPWPATVKELQ